MIGARRKLYTTRTRGFCFMHAEGEMHYCRKHCCTILLKIVV
jgi:hypothetical protein